MSSAVTIRMPQLGETVTEGTITRWLKRIGERVDKYEPFAEVATDKVNAEIPAPAAGTLLEILVREGETVPTGAPIATIGESAGAAVEASPAEPVSAPAAIGLKAPVARESAAPSASPAAPAPQRASSMRNGVRYSPAVRRAARERGVDPATIAGTGFDGRVTLRDLEAASRGNGGSPTSAVGTKRVTRIPLSRARRTIAAHMMQAKQTIPHAWTMIEVDATALVERRKREAKEFVAAHGFKPTYFQYFAYAVVRVLEKHPMLNARFTPDAIEVFGDVDLAFAVALDGALVVPVVPRAQTLEFSEFAKAVAGVTQRARSNHLSVDELGGGTITVNNTGSNGSVLSAPIINGGQAAIVTMEAIVKRPAVMHGDAIAIRSMMNVCISLDHRVVDGDVVGRFLRDLKARLEAGDT